MITVHICSPGDRSLRGQQLGNASDIAEPGSNEPAGISVLGSIGDFVIDPGLMFDRHSPADADLLTYVVDGAIDHRDAAGNRRVLLGGEVQYLPAAEGAVTSAANASRTDTVHVIQATLQAVAAPPPRAGCQQRYFPDDAKLDRLCLIASANDDKALRLPVDVNVYAAVMRPGEPLLYYRPKGRSTWLQVARGAVMLNDILLNPGDGAAVEGERDDALRLLAKSECELLLFDLP